MAKKKETKKVELKEVSRVEINGNIIITYEDGSVKIIPAPIMLTADQASEIFGSDDFDEEDIEKLRKAIAKELGIKLPAKKEAKGKGKKGKK